MAEPCSSPASQQALRPPDGLSCATGTVSGSHRVSPAPRAPGPMAMPEPEAHTLEAQVGPACSGSVSHTSGAFCFGPAPSLLVSKSPEL